MDERMNKLETSLDKINSLISNIIKHNNANNNLKQALAAFMIYKDVKD